MTETADFHRAARAFKEAEKEVRKETARAMRAVGKDLGRRVVRYGSEHLPRKGGMAERAARIKVGQTNSVTGRTPRVTVNLKSPEGDDLELIDKGILHHPTFGHKPWKVTEIKPGVFSKPFEEGAPEARKQMLSAMESVAHTIAKEA